MSLRRRGLRALVLGGLAALMVVAFGASSAWAEASTTCVKATKVSKIISGKTKHVFTGGFNDKGCASVNATHEGKFEKLASFTAPEEAQLKALLKYVQVQASGVGGKPTVQFSGANVQVVNGEGKTNTTNGAGNLVIGYDEHIIFCSFSFEPPPCGGGEKEEEAPYTQTGSHNLLLGTGDSFTSYAGVVGGKQNTISGPFASVSGGRGNIASGASSSVSGGVGNTASGAPSSVSGGASNTASGEEASVGGGEDNKASGTVSSVQGGGSNEAAGTVTSVSGGEDNSVGSGAIGSWIGGGFLNAITGSANQAAIFGGEKLTTSTDRAAIP
jgi:hypothetical protein